MGCAQAAQRLPLPLPAHSFNGSSLGSMPTSSFSRTISLSICAIRAPPPRDASILRTAGVMRRSSHGRKRLQIFACRRFTASDPRARVAAGTRQGAAPRRRARSARVVLVVAAKPKAGLVAPLGRAIEPLVHAPEAVHAARIGRIGVVHHAILEGEGAHARPLAMVGGHVGTAHGRKLILDPGAAALLPRAPLEHGLALIVVFDLPLALLLLGKPHTEVAVEVAAERRRPGERPAHAPLVRLQL